MSDFVPNGKVPYNGNILILGCGAICSCVLPIILDEIDCDRSKITVLDMDGSKQKLISSAISKGVKFVEFQITSDNLSQVLSKYCRAGDFLVDLAWDIATIKELEWCRENGVLFLNTSLEVWSPVENWFSNPHPSERTVYSWHQALREVITPWKHDKNAPTALYEHGANPGMVSYFVKKGLEDLSAQLLADPAVDENRKADLQACLATGNYPKLCMLTGTKVIHISERDTQVSGTPKRPGDFLNTWSIEEFYGEGLQPVEMCWGTHERHMPQGAHKHASSPYFHGNKEDNSGPCIFLTQPGLRTWSRSYVPEDGGDMTGMLMPHGESITIGDALTLLDDNGNVLFRPTVYFVYCPCDAACASIREVESRGFKKEGMTERLMCDDIVSGKDKLGVLLLGHDYKAWWTGSLLSIEQTRALVPHVNATCLQVSASAVAGMIWAIEHPTKGVQNADSVPWREVLPRVMPYLGTFFSAAIDWDPLTSRVDMYKGWNSDVIDEKDPWQLCNFQIPGAPCVRF